MPGAAHWSAKGCCDQGDGKLLLAPMATSSSTRAGNAMRMQVSLFQRQRTQRFGISTMKITEVVLSSQALDDAALAVLPERMLLPSIWQARLIRTVAGDP